MYLRDIHKEQDLHIILSCIKNPNQVYRWCSLLLILWGELCVHCLKCMPMGRNLQALIQVSPPLSVKQTYLRASLVFKLTFTLIILLLKLLRTTITSLASGGESVPSWLEIEQDTDSYCKAETYSLFLLLIFIHVLSLSTAKQVWHMTNKQIHLFEHIQWGFKLINFTLHNLYSVWNVICCLICFSGYHTLAREPLDSHIKMPTYFRSFTRKRLKYFLSWPTCRSCKYLQICLFSVLESMHQDWLLTESSPVNWKEYLAVSRKCKCRKISFKMMCFDSLFYI